MSASRFRSGTWGICCSALAPHLLELLATILTLIIGWLAAQARARWGVEIEARHREALHSALMTGVLRAVELGRDRDAMAEALAYARRSVPDAIRALGAPNSVLRQLAEAKVQQALLEALTGQVIQ